MKKAFVLGGTKPHIELIKKIINRGYYVILVDYTDNPPAKEYANEHLKISTLDKELVLDKAKEYSIDLIATSCIDQANSVACYVGEKLGLPIPYSYETSLNVTKKGKMKKIFKDNNIKTADYYVLDCDDGSSPKLPYPLVVKPTDANSSKGVFRVDNDSDFHEKIKESFSFSKEGKAIVERYIDGVEIEAICMCIDGKSHILMTRDYTSFKMDGRELQTGGTSSPGRTCEKWRVEIEHTCQQIVNAFSLKNTPFFIQALCNENGVYVIEFAPRIAGGATATIVQTITGYDYIEASVKSFLHEKIELNTYENKKKYLNSFLYMKPGIYDHIDGIDEFIKNGEVIMWYPYHDKGKEISEKISTNNRLGSVMVCDEDYDLASIKLNNVMSKIKVIDSFGNDVTLKI